MAQMTEKVFYKCDIDHLDKLKDIMTKFKVSKSAAIRLCVAGVWEVMKEEED